MYSCFVSYSEIHFLFFWNILFLRQKQPCLVSDTDAQNYTDCAIPMGSGMENMGWLKHVKIAISLWGLKAFPVRKHWPASGICTVSMGRCHPTPPLCLSFPSRTLRALILTRTTSALPAPLQEFCAGLETQREACCSQHFWASIQSLFFT